MKFRTYVEPPEPMKGLEVPPEVVESLGQGKRPRVTITIARARRTERSQASRGRMETSGTPGRRLNRGRRAGGSAAEAGAAGPAAVETDIGAPWRLVRRRCPRVADRAHREIDPDCLA
jgi:hypothetical protein